LLVLEAFLLRIKFEQLATETIADVSEMAKISALTAYLNIRVEILISSAAYGRQEIRQVGRKRIVSSHFGSD
jgi:hypothetical protein